MKPLWTRTPAGGMIPRCMGFAWFDYMRGNSITILFPFNHLIGFFRWGWYKIRDAKESQRDRDVGAKIGDGRRRWKQEGILMRSGDSFLTAVLPSFHYLYQ